MTPRRETTAHEVRALIGRCPKITRLSNGRVKWTPPLRSAVRALIAAGCLEREIARLLAIPQSSVQQGVARYDLAAPPEDHVGVSELAQQWGVTLRAALRQFEMHGIPLRWWAGRYIVPITDAEMVGSKYETLTDHRPRGYVTSEELMARWGMARSTVHARMRGAATLRWKRGNGSPALLYSERDVHARFPVGSTSGCPRGYVPTKKLAGMLDVQPEAVLRWVKIGCPAVRGKAGQVHLKPEHVLTWLEGRSDPRTRRSADRLRELLATREAA